MRYASVCDGIGAVHCAWKPLGWECAWTSEIDKFPIAVVERHWGFPNLGDMTEIDREMLDEHGPIELLVGGTPCQSFSVAGLRGGLDDDRGNLALRFMQLCAEARPTWVVWENVPGVLSIDGGRAFGSILGALEELGYGWAYRTLDAQWFGVAQRRRRVFVVGCLGDWRRAAAVLFEQQSVCGDPPTREA
ncbi:MAG: DNA cytosine methyltransferase, partial [Ilumatobacteraceae bacterium]